MLSAEATGYLVTNLANNMSNISNDRTVQLHNLSPSHEYSVCALEKSTFYYDKPTEIWVIAVLFVIMITLIIIHSDKDNESGCDEYSR